MSEELVLEEGASADLVAAVEAFQKEEANEETQQDQQQEQDVEQPKEGGEEPAAEVQEPEAKESETENVNEDPFVFKVKGHDKQYSKDQLSNMLNREQTFQQKHEKLRNSDEYKMGMLIAAAKSGDKGAQKDIKNILSELGDIEDLDDVKDTYDVESKHKQMLESEEEEEPFADVKDEVDFKDTLDKIKTDLAPRMPKEIFESYWADPASKRALYDLERSGQADALFKAFNEEMESMSTLDRAKVNSDPTLYGNLFAEVVKAQNAGQVAGKQKVEENTDLDVVSTGQSSRSNPKPVSEPDIDKMTKEEFARYSKKLLANAPRNG